jgi:hypothetical protein
MSGLSPLHRLPHSSSRISMLGVSAVVELLTVDRRSPERAFDVSEGGLGLISQTPLQVGTLVLAVVALPGERRTFDVIVRVAWVEGAAMGLEFLLPEDALVASIRRLRLELAAG